MIAKRLRFVKDVLLVGPIEFKFLSSEGKAIGNQFGMSFAEVYVAFDDDFNETSRHEMEHVRIDVAVG